MGGNVPAGASLPVPHPRAQGSISLWTNVPLLPSDAFNRTTFRCAAGSDDNSDGVWQASIPATAAGAYELFVDYETVDSSMVKVQSLLDGDLEEDMVSPTARGQAPVRGPKVRFVIEPKLSIAGKPLPLEAITQQTVLTRSMGPLHHWDATLAETASAGYNSVHFTPVQPLGESGSAYSIYDQLALNDDIFFGNAEVDAAVAKRVAPEELERLKACVLRAKVTDMEKKYAVTAPSPHSS